MVLITTNEPLSATHPAVSRSGRCPVELEFGSLSAELANQWLKDHDSDEPVGNTTALAELYATVKGPMPS